MVGWPPGGELDADTHPGDPMDRQTAKLPLGPAATKAQTQDPALEDLAGPGSKEEAPLTQVAGRETTQTAISIVDLKDPSGADARGATPFAQCGLGRDTCTRARDDPSPREDRVRGVGPGCPGPRGYPGCPRSVPWSGRAH